MRPSLIVASLAVMTIDVVAGPPRHEAASRSIAPTSTESSSSSSKKPSLNVTPPGASRMSDAEGASKLRVADAYGKLPLGFEANRGQTAADVQFVSRGAGYTLFLTSTEAVLALRKAPRATNASAPRPSGKNGGGSAAILRMKLVDSNPDPQVSRRDELPGESQYIIGNDPRNWHTHVPRYRAGTLRLQCFTLDHS
jgi:hypothetical protein